VSKQSDDYVQTVENVQGHEEEEGFSAGKEKNKKA